MKGGCPDLSGQGGYALFIQLDRFISRSWRIEICALAHDFSRGTRIIKVQIRNRFSGLKPLRGITNQHNSLSRSQILRLCENPVDMVR